MLIAIAAVVFALMAVEAVLAARNERAQRAAGGIEPAGDVYGQMAVAYPAAFLTMFVEGWFRGGPPVQVFVTGAAVFGFAKALKWWAILTLGRFWTFRVIVIPGAKPISSGPYRFLRHPNYIGVVGELVGVGLMAGAPVAGLLGTTLFGWLIVTRIGVEERALRDSGPTTA